MADPGNIEQILDDRAKLAKVIHRRPRVRRATALLMSLVFATLATPVVMLDTLLIDSGLATFESGDVAPITLRVPAFSGFAYDNVELHGGSVVVAFREPLDAASAELAAAVIDDMPTSLSVYAVYGGLIFLAIILFAAQLRRSHRGRLLRVQIVTLAVLWTALLVAKLCLILTPISLFALPVAAVALLMALTVDVTAGLTTALLSSVIFGLAIPFDFGVFAVLAAQAAVPPLFLSQRRPKLRHILFTGLIGGAVAAVLYSALYYLSTQSWPISELAAPLRSSLVAALLGSLSAALLAALLKPAYQLMLGEITQNRLVELEDLSHPLLKRIAENSPGTWQHSLAMANMAEIAANEIGANGRLVRVGAYYHDLGKSLQPKYFIENLEAGESSPHDRLPPEVSCDAIFAHVTEGIRVARKHGLPERIIDFMHMHHGDGLLEYFWAKCQEGGNPHGLTADDFRYPGVPPQNRETAILAICDAVEAASRTLKQPDDKAVSNLVQRIVYGKLHLGQLDESGLSMADLRKISNSLRETIKHAHHGRIEYPWQRQEREAKARENAAAGQASGRPVEAVPSATQRIIAEPRLDSLDVPRPYWRESHRQKAPAEPAPSAGDSQRRELEIAATAQIGRDEAGVASDSTATGDPGASPGSDEPSASSTGAEPGAEIPAQAATSSAASPAPPEPAPASPEPPTQPQGEPGQAFEAAATNPLQRDFEAQEPTRQAGHLQPSAGAGSEPPPPPGNGDSEPRRQRGTIELMKEPEPKPAPSDESDDGLAPGTMVIGPPPATRPDGSLRRTNPGLGEPTFPGNPVTIFPRKKKSSGDGQDS